MRQGHYEQLAEINSDKQPSGFATTWWALQGNGTRGVITTAGRVNPHDRSIDLDEREPELR
jgi:hypothetical protein